MTAWTSDGFTTTKTHFNACIGENRTYSGYDKGLQTGPCDFGDPSKPDRADRLPYQDGLLISYWNTQYVANDVGSHPGRDEVLPVDAHPALTCEPTDDKANGADGETWRPRIHSMDSTFDLEKTDKITLHDPPAAWPARTAVSRPCPSSTT